jgi:hypothetical protein
MGTSAVGRVTNDNKVKASTGDSAPDFLDGKVDGTTMTVVGDVLVRAPLTGDVTTVGNAATVVDTFIGARAYKSVNNQAVNDNTTVLVTLETESWDPQGDFASNRYTPSVAGTYLVCYSVHWEEPNGTITRLVGSVRKNATTIIQNVQQATLTNTNFTQDCAGAGIVSMNGTTDYLELYARTSTFGAVTNNVDSGLSNCYLDCVRIGDEM